MLEILKVKKSPVKIGTGSRSGMGLVQSSRTGKIAKPLKVSYIFNLCEFIHTAAVWDPFYLLFVNEKYHSLLRLDCKKK